MSALSLDRVAAVVLAGGLGTRIQSLYPNLPKPMIPVCGKPFLDWVVQYLASQGIQRVVLSCGYKAEVISEYFKAHPVAGVIVQSIAEPSPQGTAGGFLEAAKGSGISPQAWLVLNGDSLVLANLELAVRHFADSRVQGVVVGVSMPDTSRYGTIAFDSSGQLLRFEEKRPGKGVINAGVYLFRNGLTFPSKRPLSFETDVFPALLAAGVSIKVSVSDAPFLDIGTPDSVVLADAFVKSNFPNMIAPKPTETTLHP